MFRSDICLCLLLQGSRPITVNGTKPGPGDVTQGSTNAYTAADSSSSVLIYPTVSLRPGEQEYLAGWPTVRACSKTAACEPSFASSLSLQAGWPAGRHAGVRATWAGVDVPGGPQAVMPASNIMQCPQGSALHIGGGSCRPAG